MKTTTKMETDTSPKYAKAKLLKHEPFAKYIDVLAVLLKDGKSYTMDEVKEILDKFLKKGKVFK